MTRTGGFGGIVLWVGAALGAACGGSAQSSNGGQANVTPEADATRSWQVHAIATYAPPNAIPADARCATRDFTLNLSEGGQFVTLGAPGRVVQARLTRTGSDYALARNDAFLSLPNARETCPGIDYDQVSSLTFHTSGRKLEGTVHGSAAYSGGGDIITSQPVTLALSGVPDETAPSLAVGTASLDPFDALTVYASEPLAGDARVTLGDLVLHSDDYLEPMDGAPTAAAVFVSPINSVLPLFGPTTVEASGTDLAGHPLAAPTALLSVRDPGVLTQDGFEGTLLGVSNDFGTVPGRGTVPAIQGSRSLWIPAYTKALFHLKRAGQERNVRISVQAFMSPEQPTETLSLSYLGGVQAGVLGGPVHFVNFDDTSGSLATDDAEYPNATVVQELTVPVDEAGEDVFVEVVLSRSYIPMQIDELRLE